MTNYYALGNFKSNLGFAISLHGPIHMIGLDSKPMDEEQVVNMFLENSTAPQDDSDGNNTLVFFEDRSMIVFDHDGHICNVTNPYLDTLGGVQ